MIRATVASSRTLGRARAGCSSSSWRPVTAMPSRMWPVNQLTWLAGYQFCSRPGRLLTGPSVAAWGGIWGGGGVDPGAFRAVQGAPVVREKFWADIPDLG